MTPPPTGSYAAAPVPVILASASPARLATLRAAGVEPAVRVSDLDEDAVLAATVAEHGDLDPTDVALLLARAKCDAVVDALTDEDPVGVVVGCDSVLELDGQVHGKPGTTEVAATRWRSMRGRAGTLHTGHWLVDDRDLSAGGSRGAVGGMASTVVHFADLTDDEVDAYVATGEPLHVAGAFTIDGLGGPFVSAIEGDPSTVVGISLPLLRVLLGELGVGWFDITRRASSPDDAT